MKNNQIKICILCNEEKNTNLFGIARNTKDGLFSYCKSCANNKDKTYKRTKDGLITRIYSHQKTNSTNKNNIPPKYSKAELMLWLLQNDLFHRLFKQWEEAGYSKKLTPSIDRLDDYKGYSFDNIQLMTWEENKQKSHRDRYNGINNKNKIPVSQFDLNMNKIGDFCSASEAYRNSNVLSSEILVVCSGKFGRKTAGGFIWKYKE